MTEHFSCNPSPSFQRVRITVKLQLTGKSSLTSQFSATVLQFVCSALKRISLFAHQNVIHAVYHLLDAKTYLILLML